MKKATELLFAGIVMLGSLGVGEASAFASGTPQIHFFKKNPDANWWFNPALRKLPPPSEWGRVEGRLVAVNPSLQNNFGGTPEEPAREVGVSVQGLMKWAPLNWVYGSYTKPTKSVWYWGWAPTWTPLRGVTLSPSGSFSFAAPPGRYSLYFNAGGGKSDFVSNVYNGQPDGAGNGMGVAYSTPTDSPLPSTPFMFVVKPRQTVRLTPTRMLSTQIYGYHATVKGARSQLDIFGYGFGPTSVVSTDAPGITFTKVIFTSYLGSWSDQRVRTTLVMGPGTRAGTYLLSVKSLLGSATTTMTISKVPGSKDFTARFAMNFNYAQR